MPCGPQCQKPPHRRDPRRGSDPAHPPVGRLTRDQCGVVTYQNPKIVTGSVVRWGAQILLCRRAIEPSRGLWTIPAGYLEMGETPAEGAQREAAEEAAVDITVKDLFAVYTEREGGRVLLFHRARLKAPAFAAGPESEAVGLFHQDALPWGELAFPTVRWALIHERQEGGPFGNLDDVTLAQASRPKG